MFVVNPLPKQIDKAVLDRLVQAEPATIGHFLDFGFVSPEIRSLFSDKRVAGTAVTVRFCGSDSSMMHYALGKVRPRDILVVDRGGDRTMAGCGGGVAHAAKCAGALGIVLDGVATDIAELREHGMPVWARGLSSVTTKRLFSNGEFCTTISCGGVPVNPGDCILADENGILVLPPDPAFILDAAERAIGMQNAEKARMPDIVAGAKISDLNGTTKRIDELLAAQKSAKS